jgi:hypothetical protein
MTSNNVGPRLAAAPGWKLKRAPEIKLPGSGPFGVFGRAPVPVGSGKKHLHLNKQDENATSSSTINSKSVKSAISPKDSRSSAAAPLKDSSTNACPTPQDDVLGITINDASSDRAVPSILRSPCTTISGDTISGDRKNGLDPLATRPADSGENGLGNGDGGIRGTGSSTGDTNNDTNNRTDNGFDNGSTNALNSTTKSSSTVVGSIQGSPFNLPKLKTTSLGSGSERVFGTFGGANAFSPNGQVKTTESIFDKADGDSGGIFGGGSSVVLDGGGSVFSGVSILGGSASGSNVNSNSHAEGDSNSEEGPVNGDISNTDTSDENTLNTNAHESNYFEGNANASDPTSSGARNNIREDGIREIIAGGIDNLREDGEKQESLTLVDLHKLAPSESFCSNSKLSPNEPVVNAISFAESLKIAESFDFAKFQPAQPRNEAVQRMNGECANVGINDEAVKTRSSGNGGKCGKETLRTGNRIS